MERSKTTEGISLVPSVEVKFGQTHVHLEVEVRIFLDEFPFPALHLRPVISLESDREAMFAIDVESHPIKLIARMLQRVGRLDHAAEAVAAPNVVAEADLGFARSQLVVPMEGHRVDERADSGFVDRMKVIFHRH